MASALPHMESDIAKENCPMAGPSPLKKQGRKKPLKDVTNSNAFSPDLHKEMEAMALRLNKLYLDKEKTEKLLEERDAMLKEKETQLLLEEQKRELLQSKLSKLQKIKNDFNPTLSFPLQCRNKEKDKKNTDTNRQKKPLLPYILWCREQWSQVKSENPNASFKEIGAILGEKWKSSTVEDKKPYQDKYQAEKEAYLQILGQQKRETEGLKILHEEQKQKTALELLEQYLQYKKDAEEDKSKSKRREKDPLKPKQPISAFFAFCKEHRAALMGENHNILEIAKILGEQWKTMSKEMRAPYEQVASEAKERYMQEMVLYKQRKAEEAYAACKVEEEQGKVEREHAMQLLRKKEREDMLKKNLKEKSQLKKKPKAENSDPTRPKKPPTSYILFCKEARGMFAQERPGASHTTINALISVKWKELSEAEKQIWINKAAGALAQYKQEMELYKKTLKEQTKTQPLLELAESSLSITC